MLGMSIQHKASKGYMRDEIKSSISNPVNLKIKIADIRTANYIVTYLVMLRSYQKSGAVINIKEEGGWEQVFTNGCALFNPHIILQHLFLAVGSDWKLCVFLWLRIFSIFCYHRGCSTLTVSQQSDLLPICDPSHQNGWQITKILDTHSLISIAYYFTDFSSQFIDSKCGLCNYKNDS